MWNVETYPLDFTFAKYLMHPDQSWLDSELNGVK